jgi:hypothetical protein
VTTYCIVLMDCTNPTKGAKDVPTQGEFTDLDTAKDRAARLVALAASKGLRYRAAIHHLNSSGKVAFSQTLRRDGWGPVIRTIGRTRKAV